MLLLTNISLLVGVLAVIVSWLSALFMIAKDNGSAVRQPATASGADVPRQQAMAGAQSS